MMNTLNPDDPMQINPDPQRLNLYHRQQVSAMLDGELEPDAARFMLRRLRHDADLAGCRERWQVCGEVLRGRAADLLPADFTQRVMQAIQGYQPEAVRAQRSPAPTRRYGRWRGAALAAALAALALWVGVREPDPAQPVPLADAVDDAAAAVPSTAVAADSVPVPVAAAPSAGSAAAAVEPSATPARSTRPATAIPATAQVAAAPADAAAASVPDLLAPARAAAFTPRPWPRPLLPGAATGAVRALVGYGVPASGAPSGLVAPPIPDTFGARWPQNAPSANWRTPPAPLASGTAATPDDDNPP